MRTVSLCLIAMGLTCRAVAQVLPTGAGPAPDAPSDFVFVISVDGLLPGVVLAAGPEALPNMARLESGSTTHNARTDPDFTITLPNHTCMITGRSVNGPNGHRWTGNIDPPQDATIQSHAGYEVLSLFNVAHDHGIKTGLFYGKTKFSLWVTSYNAGRAPDDMAISRSSMGATIAAVTDGAIRTLGDWDRGLVFVHYATPDVVGHAKGWDLDPNSAYMQTVAEIDTQLGRLLAAIDADETHRGHTAIILTADHGGGTPYYTHEDPTKISNYSIPFLVWVGDDAPGADLYDINLNVRHNPGLSQTPSADVGDEPAEHAQPIRNGDAANLALSLLGLPPVPGSTINAHQDLRVLRSKVAQPDPEK